MDAMQEPIHCPHGGECFPMPDGGEYWSVPCPARVCETGTVAVPAQASASVLLSA